MKNQDSKPPDHMDLYARNDRIYETLKSIGLYVEAYHNDYGDIIFMAVSAGRSMRIEPVYDHQEGAVMMDQLLPSLLDYPNVGVRARNYLKKHNIVYAYQLALKSEREILTEDYLGRKTLNLFKRCLEDTKFRFGMTKEEIFGFSPEKKIAFWKISNLYPLSKEEIDQITE